MRDINYDLRKAYFSELSGITYEGNSVAVYYNRIPDTYSTDLVIVFSGIQNSDLSTKNSDDTDTTINVSVITDGIKYNSGAACDYIAGQVMERIVNKSLDMGNNQMVTSTLNNDISQDFTIDGSIERVERILTIRHQIFQS
jgi:hypothetical protein